MYSVFSELLQYMRQKKKLWLLPLLFVFLIIGGILFMAGGTAVGPFIYTVF